MEKTKRKLYVWAFAGIAGVAAFFTFAISAQAQTQECAHSVQEYTVVKEATCTEVGYYGWVCADCGEVQSYDVEIEKNAHSYDSKAYTTKATTKKSGVVTYTCSVCGKTKTKSYAKIGSITLSKTAYTYNGKAKTPKVTVKDADGSTISSKYYTVTYISRSTGKTVSSMKSVGKYYVKIKFKTKYSGTVKKAVKISPKATTVKSATGKSQAFTVKWGKVTSCTTGYQVQYSTSKSFSSKKTKTITSNTTTSKKITGLTGAKKYYVRVRTYKTVTVDGEKVKLYSSWSDATAVVTSPKATSLKSVSYSSTGKIKVKWAKKSSADGYVVQYSTKKSFSTYYTSTVFVSSNATTSKTLSGLGAKTYYVRVATYKKVGGKKYVSDWSAVKTATVKQGASVQAALNSMKSTTKYKDSILSYTNNGVDISKYSTTYSRFKAIYDWHKKHYNEFSDCLACNWNFNSCISLLFGGQKQYDCFITIDAGYYKNNDGTNAIHKWSVIYLNGVQYIFDPRMEGYAMSYDTTGTRYFGKTYSSTIGKKYVLDGVYIVWSPEKAIDGNVCVTN